jgi:predicted DNA repair protein MutK
MKKSEIKALKRVFTQVTSSIVITLLFVAFFYGLYTVIVDMISK